MSAETIEYHYGKHHRAYVDKLNRLIAGTQFANMPLEQILRHAHGPIFNNASQAWNHTFFWNCLQPFGDHVGPDGDLRLALERAFGTVEEFKTKFIEAGQNHFGSGWVWLVRDSSGDLKVEATHDADNPLRGGLAPILVCDVWEHAYYIDYRNERGKFLNAVAGILNWNFAARNMAEYGARRAAA
jgi:Fe-Mn family superoxide dismutase